MQSYCNKLVDEIRNTTKMKCCSTLLLPQLYKMSEKNIYKKEINNKKEENDENLIPLTFQFVASDSHLV